jgi:hypothetical protein
MTEELNPSKASYVGAPAIFLLERECKSILRAFWSDEGVVGLYRVGSSLERPDWRDVDVRLIMDDKSFKTLFPKCDPSRCNWEFDDRWLLLTTAISAHLSRVTGLPVDFQFQPMSHANARHSGRRDAIGIFFAD